MSDENYKRIQPSMQRVLLRLTEYVNNAYFVLDSKGIERNAVINFKPNVKLDIY